MSIKRFCDACGVEITERNDLRPVGAMGAHTSSRTRLAGTKGVLSFEVITAHRGIWNAGDFCRHCVIDAVKSLDDRLTWTTRLKGENHA